MMSRQIYKKFRKLIEDGKDWNAQAQRIGADATDRQELFVYPPDLRQSMVPECSNLLRNPSSIFNRQAIFEKIDSFDSVDRSLLPVSLRDQSIYR
jgi:hypothetical protein